VTYLLTLPRTGDIFFLKSVEVIVFTFQLLINLIEKEHWLCQGKWEEMYGNAIEMDHKKVIF
jgi:hypothetical protein